MSFKSAAAVFERAALLPDDDDVESIADNLDLANEEDHAAAIGYEEAVTATGYGWFHYRLLLLCGWALSSDAIEILSISFILPPASCQLQLSDSDKGWLNASIFLGMMVGGYVWGSLADIRGRRAVLVWSLAVNAIGGLLSTVAQVFWLFVALRIISGIGVGGSMPVVFAYFTEFQPKARRGTMISVLATFWMTGNIIAAAVAWGVIPREGWGWEGPAFSYTSWRIYLALCTLPSLTSAALFCTMPESPKFLMQKGQNKQALKVFGKMYSSNMCTRSSFPIDSLKMEQSMSASSGSGTCIQVLQRTAQLFHKPMTRVMIVMIIIFFTLSFGFYGLWMWFPELFQRIERSGGSPCSAPLLPPAGKVSNCSTVDSAIYMESFVTAAANLPGNLLTIALIDRVGRKSLLVVSMLLSAVSVFFIWLLKTKAQSLVMSAIFSGVSVIGWNALDVLGAELFPTALRSTATGVLTVVGRIGAILGNIVFGQLVSVNCAVPMLMVSGLLATGALSAIFLPSSTHIDLL